MIDWETVAVLYALLPVDAIVVGYLTAWFLVRNIKKMWAKEEAKKKWKWPWSA